MKYQNSLTVCCLAALLGACANLGPVRTFADETKKMAAAFTPMLAGSRASCTEKYLWKKMLTGTQFDPSVAEQEASALCAPIDADNQLIASLNALLEQYADTLAALADDKLPSYAGELEGLKTSLGNLKKPGSDETLIPPARVEAVSALAEFLSRIAAQRMQKSAIRELIGHQEAFNTVTGALRDYANLNYMAWLKNQKDEIGQLKESLRRSEQKEMLAARYLKTLLLAEERKLAERAQMVAAFNTSVTELQKANGELRAKFDQMDDKELLRQLVVLSKEVAQLRKQVGAAF